MKQKRSKGPPPESQASEVMTVAWTVSVTAVLLADLASVAAHLVARSQPGSEIAAEMAGILLLSAAAMGVVSLALLPIVWHTRRVRPPQGLVVFAVLVAVAPIVAVIVRLLS